MGVDPKDWKPLSGVEPVFGKYGSMQKMTIGSFTLPGSGGCVVVLSSMRLRKKTQKTPKRDLDLARERFELVVKGRGS